MHHRFLPDFPRDAGRALADHRTPPRVLLTRGPCKKIAHCFYSGRFSLWDASKRLFLTPWRQCNLRMLRMRKLRRFLETDSLYPPQAALRLFPPCKAQKVNCCEAAREATPGCSFSARRKRMRLAVLCGQQAVAFPPAQPRGVLRISFSFHQKSAMIAHIECFSAHGEKLERCFVHV